MSAIFVRSTLQYGQLPKREAAHYTHGIINPYIYDPNIPAAAVGATIIILLSTLLIYQYVRYRSWFFWAVIIAVAMETTGFISRLVSATDEQKDLPFLIAFLMILLAPSFLAAACYTAFSRVVWFSCPKHALSFKTLWCFPRYITPTFVIFDLFSFVIQLAGAGAISRNYDLDRDPGRTIGSSEKRVLSGRIILILGLILQLSCYMAFAIIAMRYFFISKQWRSSDLGDWKMWRRLSYLINIAAGLITLRAIFRTLEIPHDKETGLLYLGRNEWCFWCFDALPIVLVLVVMIVWHPGRFLPRTYTGWTLDKSRAMREKDELVKGDEGAEGELRDFTPGDFARSGDVGIRV
ncbi:hypothetical protein K458DRAFT_433049 [Lentithecium fluviatile CBS 122367]|uniref:RTA1-domain-containing protein n=1 Tax=Lentithecium fluviatile CBS 122367 TaxID=1168545 RepID=A0A6G1IVC1_9PLEO|nr:hypothetical protein K458DRAFT_433049 [Lentithecium fluviatile CBS 122367]